MPLHADCGCFLVSSATLGIETVSASNAMASSLSVRNPMMALSLNSNNGGLFGLPPPEYPENSDEDELDADDVASGGGGDGGGGFVDQKKFDFLASVLTADGYPGKSLFRGVLRETVQSMQRMDVKKGQCIVKETEYGQQYDLLFFVVEYGVFNVYQRGQRLPGVELFGTSTFGENHLIYGIPSYVTIRAVTNKV